MPFDLILWLVGIAVASALVGGIGLGFIVVHRYNKLMAYLREHHPAAYEQARPKPIWRHVYLRGAADQALNKFTAPGTPQGHTAVSSSAEPHHTDCQ